MLLVTIFWFFVKCTRASWHKELTHNKTEMITYWKMWFCQNSLSVLQTFISNKKQFRSKMQQRKINLPWNNHARKIFKCIKPNAALLCNSRNQKYLFILSKLYYFVHASKWVFRETGKPSTRLSLRFWKSGPYYIILCVSKG